MQAVTIRRSIVFAVCALGVGALYLVPSLAGSPGQLGTRVPDDRPTARPGNRSTPSARPVSTDGGSPGSRPASTASVPVEQTTTSATGPTSDPDPESDPRPSSEPVPVETTRSPEPRSTRLATAYDPVEQPDQEAPQPVREISTPAVTADRLDLSWPPARDNVQVIGYRVWLNGFEVASTAETHASIPWFNDDVATHVVRVLAVDAAGNESDSSPSILVTRPEPDPTPEPEPTAQPSPSPSASSETDPPSQEPAPTPEPSASTPSTEPTTPPGASPTTEPTQAPNRTS